jgi:hypothetical protein
MSILESKCKHGFISFLSFFLACFDLILELASAFNWHKSTLPLKLQLVIYAIISCFIQELSEQKKSLNVEVDQLRSVSDALQIFPYKLDFSDISLSNFFYKKKSNWN